MITWRLRYGYTRTGVQCRERIKKLKQDYKKTKDSLNLTGNKRKQCKFFNELNDILGDWPSTKPATVIDTLAAASPRDDCLDNDGTQDINASNDTSMTESVPDSSSDKPDNTVVKTKDSTSKETDAVEEEKTKEQKVAAKLEQDKKRIKWQTREERLEKSMNTLIDKVMKRQEECDQKFMELECKRMKLEERMLELESERRKEHREFQLHLFSMMYQQPTNHYPLMLQVVVVTNTVLCILHRHHQTTIACCKIDWYCICSF